MIKSIALVLIGLLIGMWIPLWLCIREDIAKLVEFYVEVDDDEPEPR